MFAPALWNSRRRLPSRSRASKSSPYEAGKPPADAGSIDTRLSPIYPAFGGVY
jgi:hypothetical protein